jgi:hypothetical protein
MTTKSTFQWFNYSESFTFAAWVNRLFYLDNQGSVSSPSDYNLRLLIQAASYNQGSYISNIEFFTEKKGRHQLLPTSFPTLRHHVYTFDKNILDFSQAFKIYVDGNLVNNLAPSTTVNSPIVSPESAFLVNTRGGLNKTGFTDIPIYLNGGFTDFRLWTNFVISPSQVRELYNGDWTTDISNSNLLCRIPATLAGTHFDSGTPVGKCRALDISGNNNHLILENMGTTPNLITF